MRRHGCWRGGRPLDHAREFIHRRLHPQTDEPNRATVVEQHHENGAPREVCELRAFALALMDEHVEVSFADGNGKRGAGHDGSGRASSDNPSLATRNTCTTRLGT